MRARPVRRIMPDGIEAALAGKWAGHRPPGPTPSALLELPPQPFDLARKYCATVTRAKGLLAGSVR